MFSEIKNQDIQIPDFSYPPAYDKTQLGNFIK